MKRYTVRILRSARESGARSAEFVLEAEPTDCVIDLLGRIERDHDPDLVYRHSCHHGSCGTCTVRINGTPMLACVTRLETLETTELELEPIEGFPVRADLAIDPAPLFAGIPESSPYLTPLAEALPDRRRREGARDDPGSEPTRTPPEEIDGFTRFENCIECGACVSACPVTEEFLGPAVLAAVAREVRKGTDRRGELLSLVSGPSGVDGCIQAFECSRVCPVDVYPSRRIVDLRKLIEAREAE